MVQLLSYHKEHITHQHRGSNSTLGRDSLQPTKSDGYAVSSLRVYTERKLRLVSSNHVFTVRALSISQFSRFITLTTYAYEPQYYVRRTFHRLVTTSPSNPNILLSNFF